MKETNNLLVTKKEEKYAKTLQRLEIQPFKDNLLTTDNYILLFNSKTKGFMVIDTDDRNNNYEAAFAVTTNPLMNFACPRSLFSIEKYSRNKNDNGVVSYGEKICLVTHPEVYDKKLYLYSSLVNPMSSSRFCRNQEVLVINEKSYYTCWVIEHPDSTLRYSMEGKPIYTTDPFIIRHCSTGRLLGSDLIDYYNDYGHEYEVCCNNYVTSMKYQILGSEKEGKLKIDTKVKNEGEQNLWIIVDLI
jgi:hypothetical protein